MLVSRSTIFHELGHISGYVLANKKDETSLGDFTLHFEVKDGNPIAKVFAKSHIYHFTISNNMEDLKKIYNNTLNIKRTVAYIIKVILGCTFQSIIDNCNFEDLWQYGKSGHTDMMNLMARRHYAFECNYTDIVDLQNEMRCIIVNGNILEKSTSLINDIESIINDKYPLVIEGELLFQIKSRVEEIVVEIEGDYNSILEKWTNDFSARKKENPFEKI